MPDRGHQKFVRFASWGGMGKHFASVGAGDLLGNPFDGRGVGPMVWLGTWPAKRAGQSEIPFPTLMKAILNLCCAASFACVIAFAVADIVPSLPEGVAATKAGTAEGAAAGSDATGAHARSKVLQYFDTYRADPLGLPAECAARMRSGEIPGTWVNSAISSGTVIGGNQRTALVVVSEELVRMMPARKQAVRYFLAGSNLVALDSGYKVVESIRIPTVRLPEEGMPVASAGNLQLVGHPGLGGR